MNDSSVIISSEKGNSSQIVWKNEESSSEISSETESISSVKSDEKLEKLKNAEWRTHPEDFKLIALTFDDAPCYSTATNNNTVTIIDTINKYEGAGTLFCVGKNIDANGTALLEYALDAN